jgi:outer membrane protein assembly factor BamB
MVAEANFIADPQMEAVEVELPAPTPNESWPLPGSSPTNQIAHLQATGSLQPIWQVDAGKGTDWRSILTASPIVADGKIFVLDAAGHIFVYDAASGTPVWNRSMAPDDEDDPERQYGGGYGRGDLERTDGNADSCFSRSR